MAVNFQDISMPLKIIETPLLINEIILQIKERKIEKLIIWIAPHTDWRESAHSVKIRQFAKVLKTKIPDVIEIIFHDERFSSFEAAKTLELAWEKNFDPKQLDDVAACIILQSYMDGIGKNIL